MIVRQHPTPPPRVHDAACIAIANCTGRWHSTSQWIFILIDNRPTDGISASVYCWSPTPLIAFTCLCDVMDPWAIVCVYVCVRVCVYIRLQSRYKAFIYSLWTKQFRFPDVSCSLVIWRERPADTPAVWHIHVDYQPHIRYTLDTKTRQKCVQWNRVHQLISTYHAKRPSCILVLFVVSLTTLFSTIYRLLVPQTVENVKYGITIHENML